MIGVITVVVALVLLMDLAYRGITLLIIAPAMAVLAAALSGGGPPALKRSDSQ